MRTKLICAVCATLLAACGGQEPPTPTVPARPQAAAANQSAPSSLGIKGFSIGMDINSMPNAMVD